MVPIIGRVYSVRAIIAMGNGMGSFSWGHATGENLGEAIRRAQDFAKARIEKFDLYQDNTIFHDVTAVHMRQKVSIFRQPKDYGVRGQILFTTLCRLIGIKDVYVKGNTGHRPSSNLNKIKAFQKALRNIESPQQIAERTGYHVVELDDMEHNKPKIIAEPSGFEDGQDADLEPFDEFAAYFMSQEDRTAAKYALYKKKAKEFQDRWSQPNYSQMGFGWRGRVLYDDSQTRAVNSAIIRKINHKGIYNSNFRHNTMKFSYKNEHMLGSSTVAGEPFNSKEDLPEELKGLTKLSIDN